MLATVLGVVTTPLRCERRARRGSSKLLALLAVATGACLTPPALLPAKAQFFEIARTLYPPDSESLELVSDSGATLRGLFVPAGPHAPVVLHLLDSSGSLAGMGSDYSEVAARLADMGFASLICDYSGVGVSAGERSVANLLPDAQCLWREALRRADGDASHVYVRAVSIGTVAALELLASGARPRGVLLYAPVFPATATVRFASAYLNPFLWFAANFVFRPISRLDPCAAIAASGVPCSAVVSESDALLSIDERERLRVAVEASGGWWLVGWGEHIWLAINARRLAPVEMEFFRSAQPAPEAGAFERVLAALPAEVGARFAEGSAERERLRALAGEQRRAAPLELAAAALANDDASTSSRMLWLARRRPFPELPFDDLVHALSLRAPVEPLSIDVIELLSAPLDLVWRYDGSRILVQPNLIGRIAFRGGEPYRISVHLNCGVSADVEFPADRYWLSLLTDRTPAQASCRLARELLKSERVPERTTMAEDGIERLEALWEDRWAPVEYALLP